MHVSSRLVSCEGRQIGGGGGGLSLSLARQRKMRFRPAKGAKNPRRVEESNRSSRAFNGMHHLGLPPTPIHWLQNEARGRGKEANNWPLLSLSLSFRIR